MEPVHSYKFLGLVAILLLISGLAFILFKWPQGKNLTFSQHVAVRRESVIYYVALFSITLPLLLVFFTRWFTPNFQLSPWFNFFVILASIGQFGCALIPESGGWKTKWHQTLAGLSAICLLPALWVLIFSSQIGDTNKLITTSSFLAMSLIVSILILRRGKHSYLLLLQSTYFGAFFIPVLTISYLIQ